MRMTHEMSFEIAVAADAPATPQSRIKMKIGSRTTFMTAPDTMPIMEKTALPSARRL